MHWQRCGDYLCVKVARYTKAKREKNEVKYSGIYYSFEIFHMREKGIPVDSIEIKENILVSSLNSLLAVLTKEAYILVMQPRLVQLSLHKIATAIILLHCCKCLLE